jgi:carbonic anhydrase
MKALLHPEDAAEMPAVAAWLSHAETTRWIIRDNYKHLDGQGKHTAAIEENVLVQLENLRTHPAVATKLSRDEIHLHGWVYKIETGEVFNYDPVTGQFLSLSLSGEATTEARPQSALKPQSAAAD